MFNALIRGEAPNSVKFGLKKLETSFYGMVQSIFRYLEPFTHGYNECDRKTDGQIFS